MNGKRWKRSATTVYNIGYHLIWCPKYRRKVLVGEVAERLKELLPKKPRNWSGNRSDGGHARSCAPLRKTDPTNSPHFIVNQLKSYTSRELREEFPFLKSRLPPYGRARTTVSRLDTYRKRPSGSTLRTRKESNRHDQGGKDNKYSPGDKATQRNPKTHCVRVEAPEPFQKES